MTTAGANGRAGRNDGGQCESALTLPPDVPCERPDGHNGAHRNGLLHWHDPPLILIDGRQVDLDRETERWQDGRVLLFDDIEPDTGTAS